MYAHKLNNKVMQNAKVSFTVIEKINQPLYMKKKFLIKMTLIMVNKWVNLNKKKKKINLQKYDKTDLLLPNLIFLK